MFYLEPGGAERLSVSRVVPEALRKVPPPSELRRGVNHKPRGLLREQKRHVHTCR